MVVWTMPKLATNMPSSVMVLDATRCAPTMTARATANAATPV